jgi:hypothetical protein
LSASVHHEHAKTWDGWRWLFVLMSAVFAGLTAFLVHDLSGPALWLTLIPAGFAGLLLLAALLAPDRRLQGIASLFTGGAG